jgi:uncharacterized protein involved in exopolysaccharide biosynthesis
MDPDKLTLPALVAGILSRWRTVVRVTVAIAVLALVLSFVLPPGYESQATFVTSDTQIQLPSGLSDLASGPGVSGIVSQLGLGGSKDPSTSPAFYEQLLGSRELLTRLVLSPFPDPRKTTTDSSDLLSILRIRNEDRERAIEIGIKRAKRAMKVGVDPRTSFVSVTVSTPWAPLSAEVANRIVDLVSAFNGAQRQSRARARRIFLAGRVDSAQAEVSAAERGLSDFYERNRLWRSSPELIVREASLRRQVEMAGELYLSIRQQFEGARIDEVNTTPVITVVDAAVPSHQPLWPRRVAIVVTAAFAGLWLGLLWVALRVLAGHWAASHPADASSLRDAAARMWREAGETLRRRHA